MAEAERITGTPGNEPEPGQGDGGDAEQSAAETGATAAQRGPRRIGTLLLVALIVYLLDLGSKLLVVAELEHHEPVQVIGTLLQFEVIRNRGAAFSMGEALTIFLTLIAAVVIVVIFRIARKLYSLPWALALGLLLGGAFGNLTDRIFRSPGVFQGAVVDFIAPAHFAVFNLADSGIVCGGILIVLLSFRGLDPDGTVHKD
ncbi:signal peptidase II [Streptomyces purpurogeneiscleroticus]|uniref:signal peptidase II n=1 Tax=Streptomyces purpurogeneiscleroticus TaxID=68259 RepID=UPI001CC164E7|nr:signal peptidase II [Streptomyces purpurogeneiscleroticus]MBZ4018010.1 signal peptidase II [Streptomyces purpurogeneiscleroticus]